MWPEISGAHAVCRELSWYFPNKASSSGESTNMGGELAIVDRVPSFPFSSGTIERPLSSSRTEGP
jgi:hypothetical protein